MVIAGKPFCSRLLPRIAGRCLLNVDFSRVLYQDDALVVGNELRQHIGKGGLSTRSSPQMRMFCAEQRNPSLAGEFGRHCSRVNES